MGHLIPSSLYICSGLCTRTPKDQRRARGAARFLWASTCVSDIQKGARDAHHFFVGLFCNGIGQPLLIADAHFLCTYYMHIFCTKSFQGYRSQRMGNPATVNIELRNGLRLEGSQFQFCVAKGSCIKRISKRMISARSSWT